MAFSLRGRGAPEEAMQEYVVDLESMDLPAHSMGHETMLMPKPVWLRIEEDGWLHAWEYTLKDATGKEIPRAALHHIKVLDPDTRELFSPVALHVLGVGAETAPVALPKEIGYRVEAGDSLLVTAMYHNPGHADIQGAELQLRIRWSAEGDWSPPQDIIPFFSHVVEDWDSTSYDLPPGRSHRSIELEPVVGGRVLAIGGHLHQYGVTLMLQSLPDERVIWEGRAKQAPDGTILDIPQDHFVWSRGIKIEAGHRYRLTAVYDNPTGETLVLGGMALLGGVMVPDDGVWPEVDRHSELYRWYLQRELMVEGAAGHHHR